MSPLWSPWTALDKLTANSVAQTKTIKLSQIPKIQTIKPNKTKSTVTYSLLMTGNG